METQGERIKKLREEMLDISQQRVADEIGVTRVTVTLWENDRSCNISRENLIKLSRLFSVTIDFIVRGSKYSWRHHKKTGITLPPKSCMLKTEET